MRRVVRLSSRTPSCRSRAAKARTTVGSEVPSSFAAAVRLPNSTIRTKVRIEASLSIERGLFHLVNESIAFVGIYFLRGKLRMSTVAHRREAGTEGAAHDGSSYRQGLGCHVGAGAPDWPQLGCRIGTAPCTRAGRGSGRRSRFSCLVLTRRPAPLQSGCLDPALVLVRGSPQGVYGHRRGGAELCDELLGHSDEPVVPALVPADPGDAEIGRSGRSQRPRCAARGRA